MTLDDYQREVLRTGAPVRTPEIHLAVMALGLAGEAGEAADLIKKHLGHGHPLDVEKLKKEIGDVSWYCAALAAAVGLTFEEVAQANVDKLRARYPNGFNPERSKNRPAEK